MLQILLYKLRNLKLSAKTLITQTQTIKDKVLTKVKEKATELKEKIKSKIVKPVLLKVTQILRSTLKNFIKNLLLSPSIKYHKILKLYVKNASKNCTTKLQLDVISQLFQMIFNHVEIFHRKNYFTHALKSFELQKINSQLSKN